MMEYKHSEEQRQYIQGKINKLKRENELGSTLSSQVEANEWVIKQYEMMMNQKVCVGEMNVYFNPIREGLKDKNMRYSPNKLLTA
ncbi:MULTISPECIES: hypothetical protein [Bacillus cereus group]|uniref:hypothetical protein n=1 Tax=Bacillus cereus group TaxID=86661 RepID=UPI0021CF4878|nr:MULTISPECIES: hypothetical protein [Bacillus cereus group]MCU5568163.1 hypothetical protein [Bacillus paranthracis]MDA2760949.1 hypothetical protein [Bacillus cereus group sp. Bc007]MDA2766609.1 hypothetical protein [Bacillus cereus group sp. Bc008]MDA2777751.1 hypothetical protein [Bacillus cereus group sp. Bc005]MDX5756527.1 hypothetical protein [Bacillus cereus group sp. BfR-BA-02679]